MNLENILVNLLGLNLESTFLYLNLLILVIISLYFSFLFQMIFEIVLFDVLKIFSFGFFFQKSTLLLDHILIE